MLPALLLSSWYLAGCATDPSSPDVFLISLDTTRADALSAWHLPPAGRTDLDGVVTTPNLDALAGAGVRYAWAWAHAPSTLASHATVFTGLDPHALDVPRNGFPLGSTAETLAERFKARGWWTTAVLGSSALARPMGVDRGFDAWDESFSVNRKRRHEATATEVTDRALAALDARPSGTPVFLFVHYYDAHGPYSAPGPGHFRGGDPVGPQTIERLSGLCRKGRCDDPAVQSAIREVRGAYLDEVAYVDAEVGRLLARPVGPAGRIVMVFGDHGEGLGEVPARPFGHGTDVDPVDTHVPLILVAPGLPPGVVDQTVGLQDIGTTLLARAGDARPLGEGRDLLAPGALDGLQVPMEATQPGEQEWAADPASAGPRRWNNIRNERGLVLGEELVIEAPWLGEGPSVWSRTGQPLAVEGHEPLVEALHAWDREVPAYRETQMSENTREGLKALGYEQ